ncbi:MAG: hypothetical protein CL946_06150 [Ectothiorhodospiraceae bacterium]|nr:hypothetical protein [Ectothiorhodospiraceae bacterium]
MLLRYISPLLILFAIAASTALAQWGYSERAIPMRDGKYLAADLYSIDTTVAKPVILIQTPYNKEFYRLAIQIPGYAGGATFPTDTLHYNYVIVDWRGRFASQDAADPQAKRGEDGYDAVEWIAEQPWCNGAVGTWGASALGQAQYETAREQPPHLVCCVPLVKDYKSKYDDFYYGGAFRYEHVEALKTLGFYTDQTVENLIFANPSYNNTWKFVEATTDYPDEFAVPMLIIGGWFDHFPDGILRAFHDIREESAPAVRDKHKLIYGPWIHGGVNAETAGILTYPNAKGVAHEAALRFFDFYLRGVENAWESEPILRYYQLGENQWRSTDNFYELPTTEFSLYLGPNGVLSATPEAVEGSESYQYDPQDPSPSIGASRFTPFNPVTPIGPQDQAPVEARDDVLIYSSDVLEQDLVVQGSISVELYISSDRLDTDFAIRLCDVFPDGQSIIMTDGIKRARFRESLEQEQLLTPGEVTRVSIELQNLAITFKQGHRLRIIVSSSDYPRFNTNPNNGGTLYQPGDTLVATNAIHYGPQYPSRVILPKDASVNIGSPGEVSGDFMIQSIYPNPSRGAFSVSFSTSTLQGISFHLHDLMGRVVLEQSYDSFSPGEHTLEFTSALAPGVYVLEGAQAGTHNAVQRRMVLVTP